MARGVVREDALGQIHISKVRGDRHHARQVGLGRLPRHVRRLYKPHLLREARLILAQGSTEQAQAHLRRVFGVGIAVDEGPVLALLSQNVLALAVVDGVDSDAVVSIEVVLALVLRRELSRVYV